jgi:hypothetical protein
MAFIVTRSDRRKDVWGLTVDQRGLEIVEGEDPMSWRCQKHVRVWRPRMLGDPQINFFFGVQIGFKGSSQTLSN